MWSTYLEKFVVTLGCGETFQWATSDDLITWTPPQLLDVRHNMPTNTSKMVVAMNYPTFMDPTAPAVPCDCVHCCVTVYWCVAVYSCVTVLCCGWCGICIAVYQDTNPIVVSLVTVFAPSFGACGRRLETTTSIPWGRTRTCSGHPSGTAPTATAATSGPPPSASKSNTVRTRTAQGSGTPACSEKHRTAFEYNCCPICSACAAASPPHSTEPTMCHPHRCV